MTRSDRERITYTYIGWFARKRGISVDEAEDIATRPRRWAGYLPPPPRPVICADDSNVVPFVRPCRTPEAA
jgi:hypothetical protein